MHRQALEQDYEQVQPSQELTLLSPNKEIILRYKSDIYTTKSLTYRSDCRLFLSFSTLTKKQNWFLCFSLGNASFSRITSIDFSYPEQRKQFESYLCNRQIDLALSFLESLGKEFLKDEVVKKATKFFRGYLNASVKHFDIKDLVPPNPSSENVAKESEFLTAPSLRL